MLLFAGPLWFNAELASTFHSLVEDPHALVRRTVACGFHEVYTVYPITSSHNDDELNIFIPFIKTCYLLFATEAKSCIVSLIVIRDTCRFTCHRLF